MGDHQTEFVEFLGNKVTNKYTLNNNNGTFHQKRISKSYFNFWSERFRYFIMSLFLPEGFPESVSSDYLSYQKYDTIQALMSSLSGILATQAVLEGVGVGRAEATATAAAIQWVIKDGTGMISRILFAWFQAKELDGNAKTWRLMADILNDFAIMMDLLSPLFPRYFLLLVCGGSILRSIVGVSGGCTRVAIMRHQAIKNNMADVSAKDGSQETAVGLIGLLLGLVITPIINGYQPAIWSLFIFCTFFHLYANYKAVSSVVFDSFNKQRADIVFNHVFSSLKNSSFQVLSPQETSNLERIFYFPRNRFNLKGNITIHFTLGASFKSLNNLDINLDRIKENYFIILETSSASKINAFVFFRKGHNSETIIKAYFHLHLIAKILTKDDKVYSNSTLAKFQKEINQALYDITNNNSLADISKVCNKAVEKTQSFVDETFIELKNNMSKKGWNLESESLPSTEIKIDWK